MDHLNSHPFDTLRMSGGTADIYVATLMDAFKLLSSSNISTSYVVCDGNKAQKKAFGFVWDDSIRFKEIEDIEKIIYIPFLCHRVSLVFFKKCMIFYKYVLTILKN